MLYTIKKVNSVEEYLEALKDYYPQTIKYHKELLPELFHYFKSNVSDSDTMKYCYARLLYAEPEYRENLDNLNESFKLLNELVSNNYTVAHFSLGICYALGYGTTKDKDKALEHLRVSADAGHAFAEYIIRVLRDDVSIKNGEIVHTHYIDIPGEQAVEYFNSAVEKNYYEAVVEHINDLVEGIAASDPTEDLVTDVECDNVRHLMEEAVKQEPDDSHIYAELGKLLIDGPVDYYGLCYYDGINYSNCTEAISYLTKALDFYKPEYDIYTYLGIAYMLRKETPEDYKKAKEFFDKAIEKGEPDTDKKKDRYSETLIKNLKTYSLI